MKRPNPSPLFPLLILLSALGCSGIPGTGGGAGNALFAPKTGGSSPDIVGTPLGATVPTGGEDTSPAADHGGNSGLQDGATGIQNPPPPTSGVSNPAETPITVLNAPLGQTLFDSPCPPKAFTVCFANVSVASVGSDSASDRMEYKLTGTLDWKDEATSVLKGVPNDPIFLEDILASRSNGFGDFTVTFLASVGRDAKLSATFCQRRTVLDFQMPEPSQFLSLDPCPSTEPTDSALPPRLPQSARQEKNSSKIK